MACSGVNTAVIGIGIGLGSDPKLELVFKLIGIGIGIGQQHSLLLLHETPAYQHVHVGTMISVWPGIDIVKYAP